MVRGYISYAKIQIFFLIYITKDTHLFIATKAAKIIMCPTLNQLLLGCLEGEMQMCNHFNLKETELNLA